MKKKGATGEKPQWFFPPLNGGPEIFDNAGRRHFSDAPVRKAVRELIQNSLDARDDGLNRDGPVKIELAEIELPATTVDLRQLTRHLEQCALETQRTKGLKRQLQHYKDAVKAASSTPLRCLLIRDTGTTGADYDKFRALVRQEGTVIKDNRGPGGSFGIGKNAPFNLSAVNAVVYSTTFHDGRGRRELMEGKALLLPHNAPDAPDHRLQHAGYLRLANGKPAEGRAIARRLHQPEYGTSIFVLAFNPRTPHWESDALDALLCNFHFALHHGRLEAVITSPASTVKVTRRNLDQLFQERIATAEEDHTRNELEKHQHYYLAYRDSNAPRVIENKLGSFNLSLTYGRGPRRLLYVNHNGMTITDARGPADGNPLAPRNKPFWADYAAVLVPCDARASATLNAMENPSHDRICPASLESPEERNQQEKLLAGLRNQISEIISQETGTAAAGTPTNADEMREYAPEEPQTAGNGETPRQVKSKRIRHATANEQIDWIDSDPAGHRKVIEDPNGEVKFPRDSRDSNKPGPADPGQTDREKGQDRMGRYQGNPSQAQADEPRIIPEANRPEALHVMFTSAGDGASPTEPSIREMRFQLIHAGADTDREEALPILSIIEQQNSREARILEDGKTVAVESKWGERLHLTLEISSAMHRGAYHIARAPEA